MSEIDEPALSRAFGASTGEAVPDPYFRERIRTLMSEQPYAVLCTQGGGQPYGSIIAFAANRELNALVFATPISTRKYRLLTESDRVALVVDSREKFPGDRSRIDAVTVTGKAVALSSGPVFETWQELLINKHPHMRDFISAPSTALVRIDILHYSHVARLQEVHQWIPPRPG